MASQTFNLTAQSQSESSTVTIGASERVVVRFSAVPSGLVRVKAVLNGVTTLHPVQQDGFASNALLAGTVCSVLLDGLGGRGACAGVIETGT